MLKIKTVSLPQLAWYGDTKLDLVFPEKWEVTLCPMAGQNLPALSDDEIRAVFANPVGTKPIRELAVGKEEVVIIFDDMTRPTRVYQLLPFVLEELKLGGISDDHIRFVVASGAHGTWTRTDFAKKLGEDVADRFPVYNHNPYDFLTELGETSRGTPVSINSEVAQCDLKIGIGSIVPHPMSGFGGGSKIISPGVASMETIIHNHHKLGGYGPGESPHPSTGLARIEENIMHFDMDETARIAGLDVKVDAVINLSRDPVGLFVGDFEEEFRKGVDLAKEVYATEPAENMDVAIVNAYSKANEAAIAVLAGFISVKERGEIVIIANAPDGQVTHYLYGKFGRQLGGKAFLPSWTRKGKIILFSPYKENTNPNLFGSPECLVFCKTWSEVLEELSVRGTDKAKVAVYPDATIQYPKF